MTLHHPFYRDGDGRPVLRRRPPPGQEAERVQAARAAFGHDEPIYLPGDGSKMCYGAAAMLVSALLMIALIAAGVLAFLP